MNVANKLTVLRIILIPFFIACFYVPLECRSLIALAIFAVAYATDLLDGMYARKHDQITDFGKLMDPMADKLLTASALIFMLSADMFPPVFGEVFVFVTIAREFIVSAFRLIAVGNGSVIAAGKLGKIKTFMQFITLSVILLGGYYLSGSIIKTVIDYTLISVTLVFTLWSLVDYIVKNSGSLHNNSVNSQ